MLVTCALLSFTLLCGGGVGAKAAGGACWAVARSVCNADVDEVLPVVDRGGDVHDCLAWLPFTVYIVKFGYVLFAVREEAHLCQPAVYYVP